MKEENKTKKILSIVGNVVLYVFLALCIVALVFALVSKKDSDGAMTLFGTQMRVVTSSSMEKCDQTDVSSFEIKDIPVKSMVFIQVVPQDSAAAEEWYKSLKVGDVLTFKYVYSKQETITHRIVEITQKETGGYIIKLEGDNKNADSSTLTQTIDTSLADSPNFVVGKVTAVNYALGAIVTGLKTPVGLICFIIVPCVAIMIWEIVKIVNVFSADKRQKRQEEAEKKDAEVEELKKRLAELEKQNSAQSQQSSEQRPQTEQSQQKENGNETLD